MSLTYKILGQKGSSTQSVLSSAYITVNKFQPATYQYSSNVVSWSTRNPANFGGAAAPEFGVAAFGAGKFVVVPSSTVGTGTTPSVAHHSSDGLTWATSNIPAMVALNMDGTFQNIIYGGDKFVAIAQNTNRAAYSSTGASWTLSTLPSSQMWVGIAHSGSQFVVAGGLNSIAYSSNGITWFSATSPASTGTTWTSVAYGDGNYIALGENMGVFPIQYNAIRSTNGINWTSIPTPMSGRSFPKIAFGAGVWVAGSEVGGVIKYSTNNGVNWLDASDGFATPVNSIIYDGIRFMLIGSEGAYASTDGQSWTQVNSVGGTSVAGSTLLNFFPVTQYEVPAGTQAIVSSIYVSNSALTTSSYSLAIVPNGETLSAVHYIRKSVPLLGSSFQVIDTKITLSAGDKIVTESLSSNIHVNTFGVEK